MGGYPDLRTLDGRQEQAGLPLDVFSDEVVFLAFELDRLLNDRHGDLQERRRRLNQLIMMDRTVAILGKLLEDMTHSGLCPDHRIPWNPQPLSQTISGLETNAVNVEGQPIRILLDPDDSLTAVGLVNPHRTSGPDAMGVEEDHDLADDFLGLPRLNHPLFAFGTNAIKFCQTLRCLLNDVKDLFPKGMD